MNFIDVKFLFQHLWKSVAFFRRGCRPVSEHPSFRRACVPLTDIFLLFYIIYIIPFLASQWNRTQLEQSHEHPQQTICTLFLCPREEGWFLLRRSSCGHFSLPAASTQTALFFSTYRSKGEVTEIAHFQKLQLSWSLLTNLHFRPACLVFFFCDLSLFLCVRRTQCRFSCLIGFQYLSLRKPIQQTSPQIGRLLTMWLHEVRILSNLITDGPQNSSTLVKNSPDFLWHCFSRAMQRLPTLQEEYGQIREFWALTFSFLMVRPIPNSFSVKSSNFAPVRHLDSESKSFHGPETQRRFRC